MNDHIDLADLQLLSLDDPLIRDAVAMSQRFGRDPEYTRGGGGNSSVKAGGVVYIKPSGVSLAAIEADDLVPLATAPLLDLLLHGGSEEDEARAPGAPDPVMRAAAKVRLAEAKGRRPSVELMFHSLLPETFVLHTHAIVPNAVTCNQQGEALMTELFGDEALWVPYTDPGLPLARAIHQLRETHVARTGGPAPRITFMGDHGIIVSADTVAEIAALNEHVMDTVRAALEEQGLTIGASGRAAARIAADEAGAKALVNQVAPTLRALLSAEGEPLKLVTYDPAPAAADYLESEDGRNAVLGGAMTPDQIVYSGSFPLLFDPPADAAPEEVPALLSGALAAHVEQRGSKPIVTVVPGLGIFAAGDSWKAVDTARDVYLDCLRVYEGADALGRVRALTEAERGFIEHWEVEAYRKNAAAFQTAPGRFASKVALVTGAAQGFGLGIAQGLARLGGTVVLADLQAELAAIEATAIEAKHGPGRAWSVAVDVTDETSVEAAVAAVVARYGGIDLLVSNAGVLRAGGVTEQPVKDFDFVTAVNYRGYFLAVRAVAPIMAAQHAARADVLADIVEINSKSGLQGSKRNFAYAGSKFGGVGLTQSFALELVEDGIKVNAVCPGNFYEGPLWSDPEQGLFVQYLREGKIPGATTVAEVRAAYEAKVPMGRGCTPDDVVEAILYFVAQQYETGQALPVTGGQVMLS
jgi:rhamnose utilization protein RhaD (predicted bifunctional aldolase and dehydrogenase)/NAD(P)-dependent dehydrogenase (short-subunit alcohol dehydrogenase family)